MLTKGHQFADPRTAYDDLDKDVKKSLDGLVAVSTCRAFVWLC
jgi:hypothetical protein